MLSQHLELVKEDDFYCLNYFSYIISANNYDDDKKIKQILLSTFIDPIVTTINKGIHH